MAVWHLLPACTHRLEKKKKLQWRLKHSLSVVVKKKKKKGVRGEAPFSTKSMSAPVHFDPSHTHSTIQTESRHCQNSFSVTAALSPRAFFKANFFWWRWGVGSKTEGEQRGRMAGWVGGWVGCVGTGSEAETTHVNACLLVKHGWKLKLQSVFLSALSPCWGFSFYIFILFNRKINVKPRGTIVWTSNQELSLLSLPWH